MVATIQNLGIFVYLVHLQIIQGQLYIDECLDITFSNASPI